MSRFFLPSVVGCAARIASSATGAPPGRASRTATSRASFVPPLRFRTSSPAVPRAIATSAGATPAAARRIASAIPDDDRLAHARLVRRGPDPLAEEVLPVAARPGVRVRRPDDEPVEREVRDARADGRLELLRHDEQLRRDDRDLAPGRPEDERAGADGIADALARPAQPWEAGDGRVRRKGEGAPPRRPPTGRPPGRGRPRPAPAPRAARGAKEATQSRARSRGSRARSRRGAAEGSWAAFSGVHRYTPAPHGVRRRLRQDEGRVRRLRDLGARPVRRGGEHRVPRPARAAAPRAGVGGHRRDRRRDAARRTATMGLVADVFTADVLAAPAGRRRHRPRALLDGRRLARQERAAVRGASTRGGSIAVAHNGNLVNAEALRAELEARRLDLPDLDRHRGDRPPHRPRARAGRARLGGAARRRGARGARRVRARTRCCSSRRRR